MHTIRFAVPEDAQALVDMNREFNDVDDVTAESAARDIASNKELIAVALVDGEYAGFCCVQYYKSFCYNNGIAELTELYVREAYRKRGIASGLIKHMATELIPKGVDVLQVITAGDNAAGHRVYEANGFVPQDWFCLEKPLA